MSFGKVASWLIKSRGIYWSLILLVGFGLRLFQIGHDSLWNDEVGVVLAALSSSVQDTVQAARSHVMAMPLDYILIHYIAKISLQEFVLRFPSMIFGCLTLAVCYRLFRLMIGRKGSLLAVLLLVLSPLHVMYSQEVRFYSSLLFFYYLSTLLLLMAIKRPDDKARWLLFASVLAIGAYFQIFVALSVVNGIVWTLLNWRMLRKQGLLLMIGSSVGAFFAVLPGYLYFGAHQRFNYSLLYWGNSLLKEIGQGLGWFEPPYASGMTLGQGWYSICLGLFLIEAMVAVVQRHREMIALLISGIVQTIVVIIADLIKGYWFVFRQILFLHPFALLVSSTGLLICLEPLGHVGAKGKFLRSFVVLALVVASVPALIDYFQWPKSEARRMSEYILTGCSQSECKILVAPSYQEKVYRFYLQYIFNRPDLAARVYPIGMDMEEILWQAEGTELVYLVIIGDFPDTIMSQLVQAKFVPIETSNKWLGHSLLLRRG